MIKVGITGQSGFVGTHLYNTLGLYPGEFERVPFEDDYFVDVERLKTFVKSCDVIVHLAAVNRHTDAHVLYETNMQIGKTANRGYGNDKFSSLCFILVEHTRGTG